MPGLGPGETKTIILFSIFVFIKYFLEARNHKRISLRTELVNNQLSLLDVQDKRQVQQGEDTDPVPPGSVTSFFLDEVPE